MKKRNIHIGMVCLAFFGACKKDVNQNLSEERSQELRALSGVQNQTTASGSVFQSGVQTFQEGQLTSQVTYLGQTYDNSNPNNPTTTRSVRIDITRPIGADRPVWKYNTGTPRWAIAVAISNGYLVQSIDHPTNPINPVQNNQEVQVIQEGQQIARVTFLGQTSNSSESTKTTRVRVDIIRPVGLFQPTWYYIDGTPWWAIAAAHQMEYPVENLNS